MPSNKDKTADCIDLYKDNDDPWGNRETQRYAKAFHKAALDSIEAVGKDTVTVFDVGCGGANIVDGFINACPDNVTLKIGGCDISQDSIDWINERYDGDFVVYNMEDFDSKNPLPELVNADIVSIVEVAYYWDVKKRYTEVFDEVWDAIKPGTIVLVADSLIPYQRRSYLKKKDNCQVLEEFTDYTEPVTVTANNSRKFLKVKIYRKNQ